jgi:hypothetical protein
MTALEALQSVQFITVQGKRFALLNADDWETLIEWLETVEDLDIAKEAMAEFKAADRDREKAGWLEWDSVEAELK